MIVAARESWSVKYDVPRVRAFAQQNRVTTTTSVNEATGGHRYTISGAICSEGGSCNNALADNVYGHVNGNDVPFTDNDLGSGRRNLVFGTQPINHIENLQTRTSVNVTLEGHTFHPGTVTHQVHFRGGTLYYDVTGVGAGSFPSFNNAAGIVLFRPGVVDAVNRFGQ